MKSLCVTVLLAVSSAVVLIEQFTLLYRHPLHSLVNEDECLRENKAGLKDLTEIISVRHATRTLASEWLDWEDWRTGPPGCVALSQSFETRP